MAECFSLATATINTAEMVQIATLRLKTDDMTARQIAKKTGFLVQRRTDASTTSIPQSAGNSLRSTNFQQHEASGGQSVDKRAVNPTRELADEPGTEQAKRAGHGAAKRQKTAAIPSTDRVTRRSRK
ncbi:hypothetical protein M378DRAFT_640715 [Amanita muscaria Koide BX008]|uniref:Uncharacterized protein n=1 Tax=Amanita muscaria (strain Koide BX008) TaxID=946122 RepID=A0A0C2X5G1_AMAMK|nr:hypothetical protein M378DRAFT_640715 [Amanita muscaria Koide BX008]